MARHPSFRPGKTCLALLATASLLASHVASAAINITITRTSDTLATLSVDAGSALTDPATSGGFNLWGAFDATCDTCMVWDEPLGSTNLLSSTLSAGGTSPSHVAAFLDRIRNFSDTPGVLQYVWTTSTTGALTGSALIDLSAGVFAGTGAYWGAVGTSGNILSSDTFYTNVGSWNIVAGSAAPVPEPETWALMLMGSGGLLWRLRRRLSERRCYL